MSREGHRNCIYFDVKTEKGTSWKRADITTTFGYVVARKALNWHVWENEACVHSLMDDFAFHPFSIPFLCISFYSGMRKQKNKYLWAFRVKMKLLKVIFFGLSLLIELCQEKKREKSLKHATNAEEVTQK